MVTLWKRFLNLVARENAPKVMVYGVSLKRSFQRLFDEVGQAMDFQTIYLVHPLRTRTAGEVTAAVQSLVLRLKAEGLYISRIHADRAIENFVRSPSGGGPSKEGSSVRIRKVNPHSLTGRRRPGSSG